MEIIIHKINITVEARFDLDEILGYGKFDWQRFKKEIEEHIARLAKSNRIPWYDFFRTDYIEKNSGKQLKLFFYRRKLFGIMQIWNLAGICEAIDYTDEEEENGQIRAWLKSKIFYKTSTITHEWLVKNDWAIRLRVHDILEKATIRDCQNQLADETARPSYWTDIIQEVKNAFEFERDKKAAREVALLQSRNYNFRRRKKLSKKKT
jgi:hypothetical protein